MEQAVTYIFLFIGFTMFIFAALQLTARRKSVVNRSLCALFFILGYIWLYYGLYRYNRLAAVPWLLYSDVAITFLVGPILFAYTRNLAGRPRPPTSHIIIQYLPAFTVLLYLILFNPAGSVSLSQLPGLNPDHFQVPVVRVLNTFADLHFFSHVIVSTFIVLGVLRNGNPRFRRHFRGVLIYFTNGLFTFILFFAGHMLESDNLLGIAVLANGINSIYFFFLSYRYPEYTQKKVRASSHNGKAAPSLYAVDVSKILSELEKTIETEIGFRNPNITLQSLSTQLGIQHHQLSKILNDYMGSSFRNYINRRRLYEAKRLLVEEPDMSVLDIAFDVGFNSKSAFNSAFSKGTGLVPSKYRKKHLKNVLNS